MKKRLERERERKTEFKEGSLMCFMFVVGEKFFFFIILKKMENCVEGE